MTNLTLPQFGVNLNNMLQEHFSKMNQDNHKPVHYDMIIMFA